MQREIKFRALRDDMADFNFYYGQLVYRYQPTDGKFEPYITKDGENYIGCVSGTEGQFTGLRDRNGVEIYEGDIIGIHKVSGGVCRVGYCVFEKGKYVNKYKGTSFTDELGIYGDLQKIEVIGNIHQNPELLNATT